MPSGQNDGDIFQTNQVCFVPTRAFQPLVLKPVQDRAALQEEIENPTRDEKNLLIPSGRQLLETNKQTKMTKHLSSLTWSQNVEPGRKLVVSKLWGLRAFRTTLIVFVIVMAVVIVLTIVIGNYPLKAVRFPRLHKRFGMTP